MLSWRKNLSAHVVCAKKSKYQTTTMYCRKWDVVLYIAQCFEMYHTKLNY